LPCPFNIGRSESDRYNRNAKILKLLKSDTSYSAEKVTDNGYVEMLTSLLQLLPVVRLAAGRSVPAHNKVTFSKF
jgi:hypothetical protein